MVKSELVLLFMPTWLNLLQLTMLIVGRVKVKAAMASNNKTNMPTWLNWQSS